MGARQDNPKPWEQQNKESTQAFAAFREYRDTPPEDRSIRAVAQKMGYKNPSPLLRWSSKYSWVDRARAYDMELDRRILEAQRRSITEMKERHIKAAMDLQKKALERLAKIQPLELTPKDVREFLVEAAKLERLSRGEVESIQETRGGGDNNGTAAINQLVTDPGFIQAIQHAFADRERESNSSGAPGSLDP
jgi:hypothetical protein